jgi:hypothetical protein
VLTTCCNECTLDYKLNGRFPESTSGYRCEISNVPLVFAKCFFRFGGRARGISSGTIVFIVSHDKFTSHTFLCVFRNSADKPSAANPSIEMTKNEPREQKRRRLRTKRRQARTMMGAASCYLTSVNANFIHFGPVSSTSFILFYCLCMDIIDLSYIIRIVILVVSTVYFKNLYLSCFISLILRIKVVFTFIL